MARSNYNFQKRQKELARKKKQAEKRKRKIGDTAIQSEETPDEKSQDLQED